MHVSGLVSKLAGCTAWIGLYRGSVHSTLYGTIPLANLNTAFLYIHCQADLKLTVIVAASVLSSIGVPIIDSVPLLVHLLVHLAARQAAIRANAHNSD